MRRRYLFKDRAEAEAAFQRQKHETWRAEYALGCLLAEKVEWYRGFWYDVARIGRNRADEGSIMTVFHNRKGTPGGDGREGPKLIPSVTVIGVQAARGDLDKMMRFAPTGPDGLECRELLTEALKERPNAG